MIISREVGLPCRSDGCARTFARRGMQRDFAVLTATAADRDAHERTEHGLIFERARAELRARFGDNVIARGGRRRARIGMNLP